MVFGRGSQKKKIKKLKQQVADVKALRRLKSGEQPTSLRDTQAPLRAASRLARQGKIVNLDPFSKPAKKKKRK